MRSRTSIVLVLLAALSTAVVPAPAAASSACPEAALTSPTTLATGVLLTLPWTVHLCAIDGFMVMFFDANGVLLAATPWYSSYCGLHTSVSGAVTFTAPYVGSGTAAIAAVDCAGGWTGQKYNLTYAVV